MWSCECDHCGCGLGVAYMGVVREWCVGVVGEWLLCVGCGCGQGVVCVGVVRGVASVGVVLRK